MLKKLLDLDLQRFAEGGSGGEGAKSYSEEEYNKIVEETKKLKARVEELNANEKKLKDEAKAKLTEEEKKNQELAEREKEFNELKEKVLNADIKEQLLNEGTFTREEADKIISSKGDLPNLAKTLNELFKSKLETAKKEWQKEFIDSTDGVGGTTKDSGTESYASKKAKEMSGKKETDKVSWGDF